MSNILITTLISTVISTIISYFISIRLKDQEYKQEYYKKIIEKRIIAYQNVENLIFILNSTITDKSDNKKYSEAFYSLKNYKIAYDLHLKVIKNSFWIDERTRSQLIEINKCFTLIYKNYDTNNPSDIVEAGKQYYNFFSGFITSIEFHLRRDWRNLHDVEKFLT